MNSKNKSKIAFAAIILGIIVSPAVALQGAEAMKKSVEIQDFASAKGTIKTVSIVGAGNSQFVPQIIHLKAHDSIRFINQDSAFPHDIVSVDAQRIPDGVFASSLLEAGQSFTVKFTEAGIYYYTDSIHPHTYGTIVVI